LLDWLAVDFMIQAERERLHKLIMRPLRIVNPRGKEGNRGSPKPGQSIPKLSSVARTCAPGPPSLYGIP